MGKWIIYTNKNFNSPISTFASRHNRCNRREVEPRLNSSCSISSTPNRTPTSSTLPGCKSKISNIPQCKGWKPTPPPVPSPKGVMGPPQGQGISVQQQQQLMQSVRSPPPIRSPQPSPSTRTAPSPRNQTVPSPRGPQPSPHDLAASEMLLSQNHSNTLHPHASPVGVPNQDSNEVPR
ncbi:hypothetical protein NQ317_013818 [Molorchus minor]|uniref:Uncharacterized protein n=1 Tax=Molorchus minor TaxID=1323400 RepID=A0ABQ9JS97_9CUCU|nr:hypothetical protein NQ317_013818 [Molorchus minor]